MKLRCDCGREVDAAEGTKKVKCCRCVNRTMNPRSKREGKPAKVPAGMRTFISSACANFISGMHLNERTCDVLEGFRCKWLEEAVLPTAPAQLVEAYTKRYLDARKKNVEIGGRRCECGAAIGKFQRLCGRCRRLHRRAAWRDEKQRQRTDSPATPCPTEDGISP